MSLYFNGKGYEKKHNTRSSIFFILNIANKLKHCNIISTSTIYRICVLNT